MPAKNDSREYLERKHFYDRLLTIYGRKPVLEALQDRSISCYRLHLSKSNRQTGVVEEILDLARQRNIEVAYHSREELARISRNGKQDQGVAADLQCPKHQSLSDFLASPPGENYTLIALDGISNPQNLGMIIRSVCASPCYGILFPDKGNTRISPLVIKTSAGTVFKSRIIRCSNLAEALKKLKLAGAEVCGLSSNSTVAIRDYNPGKPVIYVLGNETSGISTAVAATCDQRVRIEMNNGVESLNVAVTAALIAFRSAI